MIAAIPETMPTWLAAGVSIVSILGGLSGLYFAWDRDRKSNLGPLCRRALKDCVAFYNLEDRLCRRIAAIEGGDQTALGVKRFYRARQRADGIATPSEDATPKRLEEDLAKL